MIHPQLLWNHSDGTREEKKGQFYPYSPKLLGSIRFCSLHPTSPAVMALPHSPISNTNQEGFGEAAPPAPWCLFQSQAPPGNF